MHSVLKMQAHTKCYVCGARLADSYNSYGYLVQELKFLSYTEVACYTEIVCYKFICYLSCYN